MAIDISGITLKSGGTDFNIAMGNTVNWLTINSNGIMVYPERPYFKASLYNQGGIYTGNPVKFGYVLVNSGNCWNNDTGAFVCPVAGKYLVGMGGIASGSGNGTASYGYFGILKNGATYHYSHWNHASYWEYVNLSGVVSANAGDSISYYIDVNYSGWYGQGGHGNFWITLLR